MLTCDLYSLAWAEMYIAMADLVRHFDFVFPEATADDFLPSRDQFTIGTKGNGHLIAKVEKHCTGGGTRIVHP